MQTKRNDFMESLVPAKVYPGPGYTEPMDTPDTQPQEPRPSFWLQRLLDLRIKTMATNPPPSAFNWSAISVALLVISLIAGGAWYLGYQARAIEQLQKDIDAAKTTANQAKDAQLINSSDPPPEPTATPKEKRK